MNFYEYEAITIQSVTARCFDSHQDEYVPLDFTELCSISGKEDMKPLTVADIYKNPLGVAAVGTYSGPRCWEKSEALSHAAIVGISHNANDEHIARIGGVLTLPNARGYGIGAKTVAALIELAESDAVHLTAFTAVCNPASKHLFAKLGFTAAARLGAKTVMAKYLT